MPTMWTWTNPTKASRPAIETKLTDAVGFYCPPAIACLGPDGKLLVLCLDRNAGLLICTVWQSRGELACGRWHISPWLGSTGLISHDLDCDLDPDEIDEAIEQPVEEPNDPFLINEENGICQGALVENIVYGWMYLSKRVKGEKPRIRSPPYKILSCPCLQE